MLYVYMYIQYIYDSREFWMCIFLGCRFHTWKGMVNTRIPLAIIIYIFVIFI